MSRYFLDTHIEIELVSQKVFEALLELPILTVKKKNSFRHD